MDMGGSENTDHNTDVFHNSTTGHHDHDHDDGYYYYEYEEYYYHYDNRTEDGPSSLIEGQEVYKWMLIVGVIPVCVLGLVGNSVSVWAWNALKKRNSVVLLFQCLGVLDDIFLLLSAIRGGLYCQGQLSSNIEVFLLPVLFLSQSLSVHVTMVIGVFRQLAVSRARRTQRTAQRHVAITCGSLGAWCGLLTALMVVMELKFHYRDTEYIVMSVVLQVAGFVLPTLVLLGFSISLLRITFQAQRFQSKKKHRRTTLAVLGIAGCSFLACPVGVTGHLLATFSAGTACSTTCVFAVFGAGELLQVLNSSVNFLFYFFFASTFRPLLRQIYRRCAGRLRTGARKFSITSGVLRVTSDSDSGTGSASPHQRQDKDDTMEDVVEMSTVELKRKHAKKPGEDESSKDPREESESSVEPREESSEEPREELPEESREEPVDEPKGKYTGEANGEPVKEPTGRSTEEPREESTEQSGEEPTEE